MRVRRLLKYTRARTVGEIRAELTAAKLVGTWEGRWFYEQEGGKLTVKFTSATGATLKGSSLWYGTAVGDFSDTFSKAKVKGDQLNVPEPTMDFKGTLSEDGTTLEGTWTSPMASGRLTLKKVVEKPAN